MAFFKRRALNVPHARSMSSAEKVYIDILPAAHKVVAVTGTTGNLGSYLLDGLLRDESCSQIICLNRSANAVEKHASNFNARGLDSLALKLASESSRLVFYQADLTKEHWGLAPATYNELSQTVNLIIHNAWQVDFNLNFDSFESCTLGVNALINFCARDAHHRPALAFISSISVAGNFASYTTASHDKVAEAELLDWKMARTGYGQSKLLAERLLAHAARNKRLKTLVIRVGQLGGPVTHGKQGRWPTQEWLPSIVETSKALTALPSDLGPVDNMDWVPVDLAAAAIAEVCASNLERSPTSKGSVKFYHLVNPHRSKWSTEAVGVIAAAMPPGTKLVGFAAWIDMVKAQQARGDPVALPALKLIDYFDHLQDRILRFPDASAPRFETARTVKASPAMACMPRVSAQWMALWLQQWGFAVAS